jgi:hypothetical protein
MNEETPRYILARFGDSYGILDTAIPEDVSAAPRYANFGNYDKGDDLSDERARLNTGAARRSNFAWCAPSDLGDRVTEPVLPTEPGFYLDRDDDPWLLVCDDSVVGELAWRYLAQLDALPEDATFSPGNYLPFTRAKVVAE